MRSGNTRIHRPGGAYPEVMAESGTIRIDGATLAYTDHGGEGPVVFHAHGLSSCSANEQAAGLIDADAIRGAGLRLIAYDARGHGGSSGRPDPADYTWDNLADDLLALADVFSPGAPVHAIGVSMGTATILHALTRRPERFRSVVLGAPPTAWATRAAQAAVYGELAAAIEDDAAAAASMMESMPVPEIFADTDRRDPAPAVDPHLLPAVLRGAGVSDLPEPRALAAVALPVLLLAWDTDPGHPVSTTERLALLLPDADAHISLTAADVGTWPGRAAEFFATRG